MCDDKDDMEGARLWFYGGTPPMDEPELEEQELHPSPPVGWAWRIEATADRPIERSCQRAAA